MLSADQEWTNFLNGDTLQESKSEIIQVYNFIPKVTEIYISTQTKIGHLNQEIDLKTVFWKIPIIPYQSTKCGVIKKQIKLSCDTKPESVVLDEKVDSSEMVIINTIKFIDNPTARKIKYKDLRKINIVIAKKDLTSYRTKVKGAFYNCFVVIMRIPYKGMFKEVHIKVFNTGKLEIPGIQSDDFLILALDALTAMLTLICLKPVTYKEGDIKTVLINSNFTCNYYIDRDKLSRVLKYKHCLHVNYDPCSYPGIQIKFYYNSMNKVHNGVCSCAKRCSKKGSGTGENQCKEVSFMVFRTGSVLIVGNCSVPILHIVYRFLKTILMEDHKDFRIDMIKPLKKVLKKKKLRKKMIIMDIESN